MLPLSLLYALLLLLWQSQQRREQLCAKLCTRLIRYLKIIILTLLLAACCCCSVGSTRGVQLGDWDWVDLNSAAERLCLLLKHRLNVGTAKRKDGFSASQSQSKRSTAQGGSGGGRCAKWYPRVLRSFVAESFDMLTANASKEFHQNSNEFESTICWVRLGEWATHKDKCKCLQNICRYPAKSLNLIYKKHMHN